MNLNSLTLLIGTVNFFFLIKDNRRRPGTRSWSAYTRSKWRTLKRRHAVSCSSRLASVLEWPTWEQKQEQLRTWKSRTWTFSTCVPKSSKRLERWPRHRTRLTSRGTLIQRRALRAFSCARKPSRGQLREENARLRTEVNDLKLQNADLSRALDQKQQQLTTKDFEIASLRTQLRTLEERRGNLEVRGDIENVSFGVDMQ